MNNQILELNFFENFKNYQNDFKVFLLKFWYTVIKFN